MDRRNGQEMTTIGGDATVLIGADGVALDLGTHTISNERSLGYTLIKHYRYEPGNKHVHWFARTHIRNGRLRSPGSKGIALRLIAASLYGGNGFGSVLGVAPGKTARDAFKDTSHLIENLEIEAGHRAVLIDGQNNIIRNNHIVVDGATAIVAQGPGIVIEDNIIEVRKDFSSFSEHDRRRESMTPFPIRLIQADGAIVRNNQIRLVDRALRGSLPAAIELVESKDVSVQGNRFGGMEAPVHADAASSYRDAGNHAEGCPEGATRYLPPDDAVASGRLRYPTCR